MQSQEFRWPSQVSCALPQKPTFYQLEIWQGPLLAELPDLCSASHSLWLVDPCVHSLPRPKENQAQVFLRIRRVSRVLSVVPFKRMTFGG